MEKKSSRGTKKGRIRPKQVVRRQYYEFFFFGHVRGRTIQRDESATIRDILYIDPDRRRKSERWIPEMGTGL